jgi:hypothetical protein
MIICFLSHVYDLFVAVFVANPCHCYYGRLNWPLVVLVVYACGTRDEFITVNGEVVTRAGVPVWPLWLCHIGLLF